MKNIPGRDRTAGTSLHYRWRGARPVCGCARRPGSACSAAARSTPSSATSRWRRTGAPASSAGAVQAAGARGRPAGLARAGCPGVAVPPPPAGRLSPRLRATAPAGDKPDRQPMSLWHARRLASALPGCGKLAVPYAGNRYQMCGKTVQLLGRWATCVCPGSLMGCSTSCSIPYARSAVLAVLSGCVIPVVPPPAPDRCHVAAARSWAAAGTPDCSCRTAAGAECSRRNGSADAIPASPPRR